MKTTAFRRVLLPGIAALALAVSGCAASNSDDGGSSEGGAEEVEGLSGTFQIGGASSQEEAQKAWVAGFQTANADVTVNYDPIGSGGGRENFISGAFPLAGSDAYLTDDEGELTKATETCGAEPIEVPNYVSPIAIIHSLDGVDELNLSPEALAQIFAGKITKWNDKAIAADNPDVDLPDANINAVHRSDESGTTENFTDYLDAVDSKNWDAGVVETWPKQYGGEAAKGTSGVVQAVSQTANSIGYADASQAGDLAVVKVKVGEDYVEPSAEAAAKILEVSPRADGAGETQIVFDLDHETQEAGTYPIVLTSYLLACPTYEDQTTADFVKAYMGYVVSAEGQEFAAEEAGNAPLSDALQEEVSGIVDQISVKE